MTEDYFSREKLLERTGIPAERLDALERAGCFEPAGRTGGSTPVYDAESLREIPKLNALIELGYSLEEIRKIRRKVGLPSAGARRAGRKVPYLTVGELAQRADVSARTIKHWEEKGIFEAELRTEGGFRLYPEVFVLYCRLIKDLQNFGYRLEEIKEVADMFRRFHALSARTGAEPPRDAEPQLALMAEKIEELKERMDELKAGIRRWERYTAEKGKEIGRLLGTLKKSARKKQRAGSRPSARRAEDGAAPEPA
jgi:DNA-binding transcriptional MerR regulator